MKKLITILFLVFGFSSIAYAESSLPKCQGDDYKQWTNCYGEIDEKYLINSIKKDDIQKTFVIAGGVAANLRIRENLTELAKEKKFSYIFPPINLCSDNAAMIAWAGIERYKINLIDNLEFPSKARWPLDDSAPFLKGPGLKL